jgi:hypothetical protein
VDPPRKPELLKHLSDAEWLRRAATFLYSAKMLVRSVGQLEDELVYDEEKDLFRFRDGRFAISRERAD